MKMQNIWVEYQYEPVCIYNPIGASQQVSVFFPASINFQSNENLMVILSQSHQFSEVIL